MTDFQNGAIIDTRPPEEKVKDYKFEEIVAAADPVDWRVKPQDQWRKFPIFNQNGSGSCVAQTGAKELGIMRFLTDRTYVHFSATDIYQRRANKPSGGMNAIDCRKIMAAGTTLEVLAPSQSMTDSQMDSAKIEPYKREVGKVFAVPNYLEIGTKDIDLVASIIQRTQKGVMVWFYFEYAEWDQRPHVINQNLELGAASTCRHSVTAVDYTLLPDGKKALIIEDSWGPYAGSGGQRIIDEDFFKARNWHRSYLMNFKFQDQTQPQPDPTPVPPKPHHVFNVDLEFGMTNNDVKALQDILRYEGLFPTNAQSTGYFGAITKASVGKYQEKYGIATPANTTGYGRVGPKTRAKLNSVYGQ